MPGGIGEVDFTLAIVVYMSPAVKSLLPAFFLTIFLQYEVSLLNIQNVLFQTARFQIRLPKVKFIPGIHYFGNACFMVKCIMVLLMLNILTLILRLQLSGACSIWIPSLKLTLVGDGFLNYDPLDNIEITRGDVIQAIERLDINKASGPDTISPKLLKEGMYQLVVPYTRLFNLSVTVNKFPDPYKISNIIPVPKKDKSTNPTNYRPISLLSIQGKLMERCIHTHLNAYLINNNITSPYQSGFRGGDSTVNQLTYLYNQFSKAIDEEKDVRIIFCDISKSSMA